MQCLQIKETSIYVNDLERTEAFYHQLLGFPVIVRSEGRHVFFRTGNNLLLCFLAEVTSKDPNLPPHYAIGQIHLAFEVPGEAYESTKREIRNAGIPIEHEQHWHQDYYSFYFRDPDHHSLEILPSGMWGF